MQEHTHNGLVQFAFAGLSALVFLNLLRVIAIQLADNPRTEWAAKAIGGAITFSGSVA